MLEYNEITLRKFIVLDGEPWEVIDSHVFRKQQRKPVNATKLRNMITGKVTERSFHQSEKAEEAELVNRPIKFIYENKGQYWFCDEKDPSNRFQLGTSMIGNQIKFTKPNSVIDALVFDEKIIGLKYPIKVVLAVKDAPPAVKGNSATGALKQITLETGAVINGPLFINSGDKIRINTETGDYVERVNE